MAGPKTITIYLTSGEPDGIKIAGISQWIGKALVIPRNKLKEAKARSEISQPAVYFLFGDSQQEALPAVYIGEAENLIKRLTDHEINKDFWDTVVAFVSKENDLDKADVKYLEARCIEISKQIGRYREENSHGSTPPHLPEHKQSSVEEYLMNLQILLTALGFPVLQEPKSNGKKGQELLFCRGKGAEATGQINNEGFVIFKGSTISAKRTKDAGGQALINTLLKSGGLKRAGKNLYQLLVDQQFRSPSGASDFVLGTSSSGYVSWKTSKNVSLGALEKMNLKK